MTFPEAPIFQQSRSKHLIDSVFQEAFFVNSIIQYTKEIVQPEELKVKYKAKKA